MRCNTSSFSTERGMIDSRFVCVPRSFLMIEKVRWSIIDILLSARHDGCTRQLRRLRRCRGLEERTHKTTTASLFIDIDLWARNDLLFSRSADWTSLCVTDAKTFLIMICWVSLREDPSRGSSKVPGQGRIRLTWGFASVSWDNFVSVTMTDSSWYDENVQVSEAYTWL